MGPGADMGSLERCDRQRTSSSQRCKERAGMQGVVCTCIPLWSQLTRTAGAHGHAPPTKQLMPVQAEVAATPPSVHEHPPAARWTPRPAAPP